MSYTKGPWNFREWAAHGATIGSVTIPGVRAMMNDGGVPIMGPCPDQGEKRIAVVDCQTPFKRGKGHETECAERDANAKLIAAAPELLEALQRLDKHGHTQETWDFAKRAIAKATNQ